MKPDLAFKVKEKLKKYDFNGVVGGKSSGNSVEHGVGATIISQMRTCCSAIMLFSARPIEVSVEGCENKGVFESLSPNMLFELGFLIGSLRKNRVFTVYLDNAVNLVPSDLKGMWDLEISTKGKSLDEVADEIVNIFVSEQTDDIGKNKTFLMTDLYWLKSTILDHIESPIYYHTEMAQLVLTYCQATYMFNDMDNACEVLKEVLHSGIENEMLLLALNASIDYYTVCEHLENDEDTGKMYLPRKYYTKALGNFQRYIEDALELPDCEFKSFFLMVVYDYFTFINMMYYQEPDFDEETMQFRENSALKSIKYAEEFRNYNNKENDEIAFLYEAYTYRNIALFYRMHNLNEKAQQAFEDSKVCRYKLFKFFLNNDLDSNITEQIKMEYYLGLSDNLEEVDPLEQRKRIREIEIYLQEAKNISYDRDFLNRMIEDKLNLVKQKKKTEAV